MDKSYCYKELVRLKNENNLDIRDYLIRLSQSEEVPEDIAKLIEDQKLLKYPYKIYNKLKSKAVMKNILNSDKESNASRAKALSSLITHLLIEMENDDSLINSDFFEVCHVEEILSAIIRYMGVGDSTLVDKEIEYIKSQILE